MVDPYQINISSIEFDRRWLYWLLKQLPLSRDVRKYLWGIHFRSGCFVGKGAFTNKCCVWYSGG